MSHENKVFKRATISASHVSGKDGKKLKLQAVGLIPLSVHQSVKMGEFKQYLTIWVSLSLFPSPSLSLSQQMEELALENSKLRTQQEGNMILQLGRHTYSIRASMIAFLSKMLSK